MTRGSLLLLALLLATSTRAAAPEVRLYERSAGSIVLVECGDRLGTGFVWRRPDRVLTALHVVGSGRAVWVRTRSGQRLRARVHRADEGLDLAELDLSAASGLRPLKGATEAPRVGQPTCLIGHPFPGLQGPRRGMPLLGFTQACGRVSLASDDEIQLDMAVNPGESGAPLLNLHGEVLGIVLSRYREAQNIAQARPVAWIHAFLHKTPPTERFRGQREGYARAGYALRGRSGSGLRHGPVLAGGLRFRDTLELGLAGAVGVESDTGTRGAVGTQRIDLALGLDLTARWLVRTGSARFLNLRAGLLGGALFRLERRRLLVLTSADLCPATPGEECFTGRSRTETQSDGARGWLMPWFALDLGLIELFAVAEWVLPSARPSVGMGLMIEL